MRHILKTLRASELPKKRRHTEFSASHNWQPSAVGRHDTHSKNRATFGSGTVSARVRCCARCMRRTSLSSKGQKPCKFLQFCGASRGLVSYKESLSAPS